MRPAARVFTARPAQRITAVHHIHAHAHLTFIAALSAPPITHTVAAKRAPAAPPALIRQLDHTGEPTPTPGPGLSAGAIPRVVVAAQRWITTRRREHTAATTRKEMRVADVTRVLPKAVTAAPDSGEIAMARTPLRPAPVAQRSAAVSLAPTPTDLATITNQVLTEIDRRLIAHHERRGRG